MDRKVLKAFAKDVGIKVTKKDDEKSLAKKIREYWKEEETEMEFECPSCSKELPDVSTCPFCGSEFDESEDEPEEADENGDNGEDEEEEKPKKKKSKDKKKDSVKVSKQKKDSKKKGKTKSGPKVGALSFSDAVEVIEPIADKAKVETRQRGNFTAYFLDGVRLFHVAKTTRSYTILTNLEDFDIKLKDGEYKEFSKKEIESGHLANAVGIIRTTSLFEVKKAAAELISLGKKARVALKEKTTSKATKKKVTKKVAPKKKAKSKKKKKK